MAEKELVAALESTDVMILSNDPNIRYLFENTGFRHILTVRSDSPKVKEVIAKEQCDLIVLDDQFYGEDTISFIKRLRNGEIGANIFLPVITLVSLTAIETANAIIDVGSDDVVIKPLSVNDIKRRVNALLRRNIQYVVTSSYIGPNRRDEKRTDPIKDKLIEIPNTLKVKADGYLETRMEIHNKIQDAHKEVNNTRISIEGAEIQSLIAFATANAKNFNSGIAKIKPLALDFTSRLANTDYKHISEMCAMLNAVVEKISGFDDKENIEMLQLIGNAIALTFQDDDQSRKNSQEVIMLVKQKFKM